MVKVFLAPAYLRTLLAAFGAAGILLCPIAARATENSDQLSFWKAPFARPNKTIADLPSCPPPPKAPIKLTIGSMYADGDESYSKVVAAQKMARAESLAPIREFTAGVSRFANRYVASGGKDTYSGGCALVWLNDWARAGAMRNMAEHESQFVRSVNLSGWALAYSQVRYLQVQRNSPHYAIRQWLRSTAEDMRSHVNGVTNNTARNNHRYWAGLAAIAVSMDTGDVSLGAFGLESARVGIAQVTSDGVLPLELDRKSRAAHYHLYAAAPLVMTAAIARANGIDLYAEQHGALHRLVRFATEAVIWPGRIEALAHARQDVFNLNSSIAQQNLAWFEFYARDFPNRAPEQKAILRVRPLRNNELGGDLTMLAASN
ncbi:alginate lyase family protein [Stakelama pacifica]|uniref:alginate lyase family protein n=1 Tax=Stakelama pacifica TaxID=517720 RepID=UPI0013C2EAA3|nr:alginate lyase family protein [Stakelama pacifica]